MLLFKRLLLAIGLLIIFEGCSKEKLGLTDDEGKTFRYSNTPLEPGITYGSIYYSSSFNAFTDLAFYNGKWIAVFREGVAHADNNPGRIKIVTSKDGNAWKVENVLSIDSIDLRDPKVIVDTLARKVFITFFGRDFKVGTDRFYRNYVVGYTDTVKTENIKEILQVWPQTPNYILWRWTVLNKQFYGMAYRLSSLTDTTTNLCLTIAESGFSKYLILKRLSLSGQPTETTLRFDKTNRMYLMIRADGGSIRIGYSNPPYNDFTWMSNGGMPNLGSPNFIIRDSLLIVTGRTNEDQKFRVFVYDISTMTILKQLDLPGGYEVGYGGMSMNPANRNELWISYYSIEHGGLRTNIYLVKMNLKEVLK